MLYSIQLFVQEKVRSFGSKLKENLLGDSPCLECKQSGWFLSGRNTITVIQTKYIWTCIVLACGKLWIGTKLKKKEKYEPFGDSLLKIGRPFIRPVFSLLNKP